MSVNITIEGDGLSFKGETELNKAVVILGFLTDTKRSETISEGAPGIERPKERKSPRQAIMDLNASSNAEKVAAFLRYFLDKDGRDSLTTRDIEQTFTRSGEPKPGNLHRDIKKAINKGYIVESESERGAFSL